MLSTKNKKDIDIVRQYGRANDMLLLREFFPKVCPFKDLIIIESEEDYIRNQEYADGFLNKRPDAIIGAEKTIKSGTAKGTSGENLNFMKRIKEQTPDGVMILFNPNHPQTERYGRDGGISIAVDLGKNIYIDCLGKGFDCQLLSKGNIVPHESYTLTWEDIQNINIENIKQKRTVTNNEEYQKSVKVWSKFLKDSVGYSVKEFSPHIPKQYQGISAKALSDAIAIIKKLPNLKAVFDVRGLNSFIIQGNIKQGRFTPWQLSDPTRFVAKLKSTNLKVNEAQLKKQQTSWKEWQKPFV